MPTKSEVRQELIWRKCQGTGPTDWEACLFFLENFWYIKHPEKGRIRFKLRDAQKETLQQWLTNRYSIVLKARQIGFSTLAAAMAFWLIYFHSDKFIVMLSRTEREATKLLDKSKYGYRFLPEWMLKRGPNPGPTNQLKLSFDNESGIESLPSAKDPGRGESVSLVIVDEWASLENPEEAWAAIEPIADVGGRIIGLSTAKGSGNFFHQFWVRAVTGTSTFKPIFFPWHANTDRDDNWYQTVKRNMPDWQLHQEYPETPEEAFVKSGNPVFDVDALADIEPVEPLFGELLPATQSTERSYEFHQSKEGEIHVWERPIRGVKYVIGADVAEGLEFGDYSVCHVINTQTGKVAAKYRGHIAPDLFGSELLWAIGHWYNYALVGVEMNGHGYTTLVALNLKGYANLYYRHHYDERTNKRSSKLGWATNKKTKPLMIDELGRDLRPDVTGESDLLLVDAETIGELRTFVRDADGKMHGSPYDDQVISLAIANQMRKHAYTLQEHEDAGYKPGTIGALLEASEAKRDVWLIGHGRNIA